MTEEPKNTMLYRYELYCDGEYQEVGFMQDMWDIFSDDRARGLCRYFDENLPISKYYSFEEKRTCAFFTELGIEKFKPHIKAIIKAYKEETIYDVKRIKVDKRDISDAILYKDKYQVIVKESAIHKNVSCA